MNARPLPDVPLDGVDLSDMEFWAEPCDVREATFKKLRDTDGLIRFEELGLMRGG